jgi:hypothetical protein
VTLALQIIWACVRFDQEKPRLCLLQLQRTPYLPLHLHCTPYKSENWFVEESNGLGGLEDR